MTSTPSIVSVLYAVFLTTLAVGACAAESSPILGPPTIRTQTSRNFPSDSSGELSPGVREIGSRAKISGSPFKGSHDFNLKQAIRTLVPGPYTVGWSSCVPQQLSQTYSSGEDWVGGLAQIAAAADLSIFIDHDAQEVRVSKVPAVSPDAVRTWLIFASDKSIKRALERWSTQTCVQLQWDVTFPLEAASDVAYENMSMWDALAALATDLAKSNTPVHIVRHRNNLVRVSIDSVR